MSKKAPSPSEMMTLQHLWERQTATIGELHRDICKSRKIGYTTVLKQIQRMEEKGFVERVSTTGRAHTFRALYQPESTRRTLVQKLIKIAFDDSPNALIQHAIGEHNLSKGEIDEIRNLLDALERDA